MALGADRSLVLRMVLSMGLRLLVLGAGIGLLASFGLSRALASQLFGVSTFDTVTLDCAGVFKQRGGADSGRYRAPLGPFCLPQSGLWCDV